MDERPTRDRAAAAERWRFHITAVVALTALALIHQHRQIFLGEIPRWPEISEQYEPMRAYQVRALREGRIPLWCRTMGLGLPMLAMSEEGVFHPINLIVFSLMDAREGDLLIGVARMILAGVIAYAVGRAMGLGFFGALLAAAVFQFNGFFTPRKWLMLSHASWVGLPLMLLAAERLGTRPRAWTVVWASVVIGLALLGGHYQLQFIAILFYGFYGGWRALQRWGVCRERAVGRIGALVLPVALGFALAAVQVAATAELQPLTAYEGADAPEQFGRADADFDTYRTVNSFPPHHVNMYVLPFLYDGDGWLWETYASGPLEVFVYVGILPLVLACVAWRRRAWKPFAPLIASAALFTLLSCGRFLPGFEYLLRLPGFGWFVYPSRFAFPVSLCVGLVAGVGLDEVLAVDPGRTRRWVRRAVIGLAVVVALAVAVVVVERLVLRHHPEAPPWKALLVEKAFRASWSLPAIAASLVVFYLLVRKWRYAAIAAVLVASADMMSHWFWFPKGTEFEPQPLYVLNNPGPILKHLPPPGDTRIAGGPYAGLALAGHQMMWMYPPFAPYRAAWVDTVTCQQPYARSAHLLRAFHIRYLLTRHDLSDPRLKLLWHGVDLQLNYLHGQRSRDWNLYKNTDVLPRAYLVDRAEWYADRDAARERVESPSFDPARSVVLEGPGSGPTTSIPLLTSTRPSGIGAPSSSRPAAGPENRGHKSQVYVPGFPPAVIEHDGETRIVIRVTAHRPAWLVLSDQYYPGWRATVNGDGADVYPANYAVRAVRVPAGESTVTFVFDPPSWGAGVAISLATLALLLIAGAVIGLRRLRARRAA